jgi:hypothetical protein
VVSAIRDKPAQILDEPARSGPHREVASSIEGSQDYNGDTPQMGTNQFGQDLPAFRLRHIQVTGKIIIFIAHAGTFHIIIPTRKNVKAKDRDMAAEAGAISR